MLYYHPSAVEDPENMLKIRDLLLSVIDPHMKHFITEAIKHIFIAHAMTWFTPQNLGLSILSEANSLTIQTVVKIKKQLTCRQTGR